MLIESWDYWLKLPSTNKKSLLSRENLPAVTTTLLNWRTPMTMLLLPLWELVTLSSMNFSVSCLISMLVKFFSKEMKLPRKRNLSSITPSSPRELKTERSYFSTLWLLLVVQLSRVLKKWSRLVFKNKISPSSTSLPVKRVSRRFLKSTLELRLLLVLLILYFWKILSILLLVLVTLVTDTSVLTLTEFND